MAQAHERPGSSIPSPSGSKFSSTMLAQDHQRVNMLQAIREATRCRRCGGIRAQATAGLRWHGMGSRGDVLGTPTRFEDLTPREHCVCPGSRLWTRLNSLVDNEEQKQLGRAQLVWETGGRPDWILLPAEEPGEYLQLSLTEWREYLVMNWEMLTGEAL